MVDELFGGAFLHDHAAIHEEDAVRHIAGKVHLVGDDDHGRLAVGKVAQDAQHLAGQLRVEGRGRLIEAEDVRAQGQRTGNGHALLLAAGQLVRIVSGPLRQTHLGQKLLCLLLQLGVDGLFAGLVVRALFGQQLTRQHDVLQRGVLREKVEVLEHQTKVEPLLAHFALPLGGGVGGVPHGLAVHLDDAGVRPFQKIQAAQQGRLAGTRRTDDGQRLALLQSERNVLEDVGVPEIFPDAGGFEQCHN